MSKKANPTLIGAFVVGGIALAVVGVAVFGSGRFFHRTYRYVMYFDRSVNGLNIGAPVKFKGVQVGAVTDITLNVSGRERLRAEEVRIPVIIEIDADRLRGLGTRGDPTPAFMAEAIQQGFRAQLRTESFVTGVLYIELDFVPGSPVNLVGDPTVKIPEIPTLPTALEQVQSRATEIIARLSEVDFRRLLDSVSATAEGLSKLVNSPGLLAGVERLDATMASADAALASIRKLADHLDTDVGPLGKSLRATADGAAAALATAQATLADVRTLVEPGSPLAYQLGQTLSEVGAAARALRTLAESLERDPSVLVRGRAAPDGGEDHRR